jgi:chitodextrinase
MGIRVSTLLAISRRRQAVASVILTGVMITGLGSGFARTAYAIGCPPQSVNYGTVTSTVSVPADATYRVWTRMKAPDASNTTYLIDIDGNSCYSVGGAGVPVNTWTWVAHHDGSSTAKIDVPLTKGNHTIKFVGNAPNVKVDRLVLAADLACLPTGDGANCDIPPDTADPTVQLTAPAVGSTVRGTVAVTANASDNVGVKRVEFFLNGALLGTDTSAPYTINLDTTTQPNGSHSISARAYDAASRSASDTYRITIQNSGDTQAPSVPAGVTATAPEAKKVVLKWTASSDNVGVKGYRISRDGVPLTTVEGNTTYTDATVLPSTTYSYRVAAYDAAGNTSINAAAVSIKTPAVADVQPPTKPESLTATALSSTQIDLKWTASSDNVGVAGYDVYRVAGSATATKVATNIKGTSFGDAKLNPNTRYTYYVVARDSAGNLSPASAKVSAQTKSAPKRLSIRGVVRDEASHKPVAHALVTFRSGTSTKYYATNKRGEYAINHLADGRYVLTYKADGYRSAAATITMHGQAITKDINLRKR